MLLTASKRFRAHLPVVLARDGHPGEARGLVHNLSIDGCKVTSDAQVMPGSYLSLQLHLPAPHAPLQVRLAAVRWTQEWDFGVTFLHVEGEEFQRLTGYLAGLEPVHAIR